MGSILGVAQLPDDHYAVYKAITRYSVVERHKHIICLGFGCLAICRGSEAQESCVRQNNSVTRLLAEA